MAKNTVYIAGPMRGYPRFNVDAFDGVAATWKQSGFSVRNPAEMDRAAGVNHDAEVTSEDLRACMRRDLLAILDECSAIALLPGWEKSAGVKVELALARFLGLPVYDAVTFERIKEGDKPPTLDLMQEFTTAEPWLCEEAQELQAQGARFEAKIGLNGDWSSRSFRFRGKHCVYRMVSLPPGEPAPEPTIEPGEEFGPDKFELAKTYHPGEFEYWNTTFEAWQRPFDGYPSWCSFDRYRRKPESQEQTVEPVAAKPRKGDPDENILAEAMRITAGDRQASYGPPDQDFARTAAMWSAIKGVEFEAREVALFMILLKVSRETHQRKRDNAVDIAGYAKCLDICNQAAKERGQ